MRVAVIGQGYVGFALSEAAFFAGHEVIGIEVDLSRIQKLIHKSPYEITNDFSMTSSADIVVIAVPTPLDDNREPDLSYLVSACESLKPILSPGTLVINESTSFPGTLRNVIMPILGEEFLFASAPERIDPANSFWRIQNTPRLIAGITSDASKKALAFYMSICGEVHEVSSPEVAEAAKIFENTFRQVNIALVNEFAKISNVLGISSHETLDAAATKPFGFMKFVPSVGVGGHCIPVDPSYLSFIARKMGVESAFIDLANNVNASMPQYIAERIAKDVGGEISGKRIQIAGISYKADVPDTRESPALVLMRILRESGAQVLWNDDVVVTWNGEESQPIQSVDIGIICTLHTGVNFDGWVNGQTKVYDVSTDPQTSWRKFL